MRLLYWGNMRIDYDQVQILQNAHAILSQDFSLIGPKTGPANMFMGPLIYYVAVPFVYVFGDFMAVVYTPLFFSLLTGAALYWLTSKYIEKKEALIVLALWAFSPFLIDLDRIFWNPNLTLLAAALLFIPQLKSRADSKTFLFLFAGAFLAYQAHFSGFLLVGLGILLALYLRHPWKYVLCIGAGLTLSLLPTLLFDIRNDYLNFRGLMALFSSQDGRNFWFLIQDSFHNMYILAETLGKILLFRNSTPTIVVTGAFLFGFAFSFFRKEKIVPLTFVWCLIIALCFSFYRGPKPEYYFLIAVPPLLLLLAAMASNLKNLSLFLILLFFGAHAFYSSSDAYKKGSGMTIAHLQKIQKHVLAQPVKDIQYDMPFGTAFGASYIVSRIPLSEEGSTLHISYPHHLQYQGLTEIGDVGVWADKRNPAQDYVTTDSYFLTAKPGYFFYSNTYPRPMTEPYDVYMVVFEGRVLGELSVAPQTYDQEPWVQECLANKNIVRGVWMEKTENTYVYRKGGFCLEFQMKDGAMQSVETMEIQIL